MTGKYGSRKGAIVQVPQLGTTTCFSHVIGLNAGAFGTVTPFPPPAAQPLQVPANPGKPQLSLPFGCVRGSTAVTSGGSGGAMVMGSSPASFTVPTSIFHMPAAGVKNVTPVPNVPRVVQFGTQASMHGPLASPATPPITSATMAAGEKAQWRLFKPSAWTSQTGRPGVNFTACWGAAGGPPGAVGSCNNINQGTRPLIAKYRGTGNFGGTMGLILNSGIASPNTLAITGATGLTSMQILIQANSGSGSGARGAGYRATQQGVPAISRVYASWVSTAAPTIGGGSGPIIKTLGPKLFTVPPGGTLANLNEFPFTVGSVLVRNTGGTQGGNPVTVTLSAKGVDSRNATGVGRIQLVSGGLIASVGNSPTIDIVSFEFVPEPGTGLMVIAGGLFLAGASRLRRRRR